MDKISCGGFYLGDGLSMEEVEGKPVLKTENGMPDPSSLTNGTALVAVDGEWTQQEGYGYVKKVDYFTIERTTPNYRPTPIFGYDYASVENGYNCYKFSDDVSAHIVITQLNSISGQPERIIFNEDIDFEIDTEKEALKAEIRVPANQTEVTAYLYWCYGDENIGKIVIGSTLPYVYSPFSCSITNIKGAKRGTVNPINDSFIAITHNIPTASELMSTGDFGVVTIGKDGYDSMRVYYDDLDVDAQYALCIGKKTSGGIPYYPKGFSLVPPEIPRSDTAKTYILKASFDPSTSKGTMYWEEVTE